MISNEGTKRTIIRDVISFFDAKDMYAEFETPWKVSHITLMGQLGQLV